jgi:hypothetical protein
MKLKMKKFLLIIMAMLGIFHANLLAQTANHPDGLKPWQQSPEQNEAAQLPTINKAFDVNKTSDGNIKLDSIIALKRQLEYLTYDSQGHLISDRIYVSYDPILNLFNSGY